ncbi:hypothetical protein [Paenibacillus sp. NPDC058071]|uniref:hypothetical protein n=1 Tax=Paenibacillus sp. NPDC058071 TaxID=3346326 RepID=UPI0036DF0AA5
MRSGWALLWIGAAIVGLAGCTGTGGDGSSPSPGVSAGVSSGSSMETRQTLQPSPSAPQIETTAAPEAELDLIDRPLDIRSEQLTDGILYRVENADAIYLETYTSPEVGRPDVHLYRRNSNDGELDRYKYELLVTDSKKGTYTVIPLVDIKVQKHIDVDTSCRGYGFVDPDRLVLTVPSIEKADGGIGFRVATLDLRTNKLSNIAAAEQPGPETNRIGRSWLDERNGKLYVNGYGEGQLWIADIAQGTIERADGEFRNSWPFFMTIPSPTGERFWYWETAEEKDTYKLHDEKGKLIRKFDSGYRGIDGFPAFLWSPDGRYAEFEYARDTSPSNIVGESEVYIIAPQGIKVLDKNGKLVWQTKIAANKPNDHMEWAGWIEDEHGKSFGIVRRYRLALADDGRPEPGKLAISYERIDVENGKVYPLKEASSLEELERPQMTIARDRFIIADTGSDRYLEWDYDAVELYSFRFKDERQLFLTSEYDEASRQKILKGYDPAVKRWMDIGRTSYSSYNSLKMTDEKTILIDRSSESVQELEYRFLR